MTIIGLYGNRVLSIPISDTIIDTALYSHHWKYFHSWVEYLLLTIMLQMIRMDNMENIWAAYMQPITDPLAKTETKITTMILDHCDHDKYKYVYVHTNTYTYK